MNRSTYYYKAKQKKEESELVFDITEIFKSSCNNYGTRKIKKELLGTFEMERFLSHKGCYYDNAVAEATFKVIKTEFVWKETLYTLEELKLKLGDYIHGYK